MALSFQQWQMHIIVHIVQLFIYIIIILFIFFKDLGRRIAATTKEHCSFEFLMQRVSVVVQRGNAACVLGTTSDNNNKLEDLFYIL